MYDIRLIIHTIFGDEMKITILLKQIREERQMSLEKLSRLSGVSTSHLNYIEKQQRDPTLTVLIKIAKALNIDVKNLYRVEW